MKFRFIQYHDKLYLVRGIGFDTRFDPPEVFHCVELTHNAYRSLLSLEEIIIPVSEAEEITDKNRMLAIWTLFGR
jgi:hypothetical protein